MKTLVVLSFLVGLAIAAPASQEKSVEEATKEISSKTPDLIKREKKSPQLQDVIPSSPEGASGFNSLSTDFNADVELPNVSARSHFGKKGPIIVKKKSGYHFYRDSEEERAAADSQETCGKQMRVKVCNVKSSAKSADLAEHSDKLSNNDVESSIKVAKEAIESLQKDMQQLEQTGHWKHGKSEADTSMHHNIETVRQALQQVQGRIGKLEVMNLQAKTLKGPLADDTTKGKSEEERLAQWKEAMDNIQKNVEVARNIEDSFKSADELPEEIHTKFLKNSDQEHNNHEMSAKSTSTNNFDQQAIDDEKDKSTDADHHKPLGKSTIEKTDDQEMMVAPSEPIASKIKHHSQQMATEKSAEITNDGQSSSLDIKHNTKLDDKKDRDAEKDLLLSNNKEDKDNGLNKETAFRASEIKKHGLDLSAAGDRMHELVNDASEQVLKATENTKSGHHSKGKNTWDEDKPEDTFMKSADQTQIVKEVTNEIKSDLDRAASLKDAEKMASNVDIHNEALKHDKPGFHMKHSDSSLMLPHNQGMHISGHEMKMPGHGMHMTEHDMHKGGHDMGLVGHEMKMHGHGMHMANNQMNHGKQDLYMAKHGKHMLGHDIHMQGHGMPAQGMHMSNIPGHIRKPGKYGKSSDFDNAMQPSIQMSMHETAGKSAMDNLFQWKHHDSARAAYGGSSYAAGGTDALGIFPNAKVGGCGIPLLLSCSPSVVQGNLAKSHSSYASPAYRNEDDFGLKKKRDIIKTKDVTIEKANPTAPKKNIEILETLN